MQTVTLPDGRRLEALVVGPSDGRCLVFHHGTPGAGVPFSLFEVAAESRRLRFVLPSRAGYASSDPAPGRVIADVAADTTALLDAVGADEFVTMGWSGGGPHALACAALLPDRCRAAASLAGVAPYGASELDWLAGMGAMNLEEFEASLAGFEALSGYLESQACRSARSRPPTSWRRSVISSRQSTPPR